MITGQRLQSNEHEPSIVDCGARSVTFEYEHADSDFLWVYSAISHSAPIKIQSFVEAHAPLGVLKMDAPQPLAIQ